MDDQPKCLGLLPRRAAGHSPVALASPAKRLLRLTARRMDPSQIDATGLLSLLSAGSGFIIYEYNMWSAIHLLPKYTTAGCRCMITLPR